MFTTLIESRPGHQVHAGETLVSTILHVGLVAAAIVVTAQAGARERAEAAENIIFSQPTPEAPKPAEQAPAPKDAVLAPPPPKGFQTLVAPVDIPDKIPDVDLSKTITNEADFSGRGVQGGIAKGVEGGTPQVIGDQPYFEFQVEKPVMARDGNPAPKYPTLLETSKTTGEVLAQFVVDTAGRVEPGSLRILKSSDALFANSVTNVLPRLHFYAAEVGGRKVRAVVQLPFRFVAPDK